MRRRPLFVLVFLLSLGQVSAKQKTTLPQPLFCANIHVGIAKQAEVIAMYGRGLILPAEDEGGSSFLEDHLGGRYYIDRKHLTTLHYGLGNDNTVDFVEYQQGLHIPQPVTATRLRRAETPRLKLPQRNQPALGLGTSLARFVRTYGKPQEQTQAGNAKTLWYTGDYLRSPNLIGPYKSKFVFRQNRLVYIAIYTGELQ